MTQNASRSPEPENNSNRELLRNARARTREVIRKRTAPFDAASNAAASLLGAALIAGLLTGVDPNTLLASVSQHADLLSQHGLEMAVQNGKGQEQVYTL